MKLSQAIWIPAWYNLDQSLEIGKQDEFALFRSVPDHLQQFGDQVFYNDLWNPDNVLLIKATVVSITNPVLGAIRKIDTSDQLDYTITLSDGTELLVNAEEEPGKLYERVGGAWTASMRVVEDWRVIVEFSEIPAANQALNPTGNKPAS
jgi:hypothetical protein